MFCMLNGSCKWVLMLAIAVLAVGPFLACGATVAAPTTWTITVDITSGAQKPTYQVTASPDASQGGCPYAKPGADATNLMICPNDSIVWIGTSKGQKHELVVFVSDQILTDNGAPVATFSASDNKPTHPGTVSATAAQGTPHEWYVALFDKKNALMHHDDPKIIIGSGT